MTLEEIGARLEIADVLHRYCRGVDRGDLALLQSVYHPDAIDNHGVWKGNGHDFARYLIESMDRAPHVGQHHITNVLIERDGEAARVESYFIAWHPDAEDNATGAKLVPVGGRYLDRFERRGGAWKIAAREVIIDWTDAPRPREAWVAQRHFPKGGRRESDPSYGFLSNAAPER